MKKINIILDETTVLNFPFLWKLMKRYWLTALALPVLALIFGLMKYSSQNTIFMSGQGFKNTAEGSSPTSAISALLGEKNRGLDETEIISIPNSIDFRFQLAENLMKHSQFSSLNFNAITAEEKLPQSAFFTHCGAEKDCVKKTVASLLPNLYSVVPEKGVINRFLVVVRTLEPETTKVLMSELSRLIEEDRVRSIQSSITQQIKISRDLIESKKKELDEAKINEHRDRFKFLESEISDVDRKLSTYRVNFFSVKQSLSQAETILNETLKTRNKKVNVNDLMRNEKAEALEKRISQLRDDLNSLEVNRSHLGDKDKTIISQIKKEIQEKERELKAIGDFRRSISSVSEFIKSKDKLSPNQEFDYAVLKSRFDAMKKEYDSLVETRESLVKEMTQLENIMDQFRPSIEFLKLLEEKSVQLKLAESTVVSDLIFDSLPTDVSGYKKTSLGKIMFISLASGLFFMLIAVLLRYFADGRIYDEYELQSVFKDLEIIGNTPDFQ